MTCNCSPERDVVSIELDYIFTGMIKWA